MSDVIIRKTLSSGRVIQAVPCKNPIFSEESPGHHMMVVFENSPGYEPNDLEFGEISIFAREVGRMFAADPDRLYFRICYNEAAMRGGKGFGCHVHVLAPGKDIKNIDEYVKLIRFIDKANVIKPEPPPPHVNEQSL